MGAAKRDAGGGVRFYEGVPYRPYLVTFRTIDGKRHRWTRWSPGFPWVYDEVGRELVDRFDEGGIKPRSCTILVKS